VNLFETLFDQCRLEERVTRIEGVVVGLVTKNQDPDGQGRVKVKFPCSAIRTRATGRAWPRRWRGQTGARTFCRK
jgi:hypothetical protein